MGPHAPQPPPDLAHNTTTGTPTVAASATALAGDGATETVRTDGGINTAAEPPGFAVSPDPYLIGAPAQPDNASTTPITKQ